uniref:Reverse transcriptase n=1 Tax=Cannabis sativa TaxID=3483 RepID=A0A803PMH7_CANSA
MLMEGSTSVCTRPSKVLRQHPGVVRDFSWDNMKSFKEGKAGCRPVIEDTGSRVSDRPGTSVEEEGDNCYKFFFLSATIRGRRNTIESLLDKNDICISRCSDIGKAFAEFLRDIFSNSRSRTDLSCSDLIQNRLSPKKQEDLVRIPNFDEIQKTLFAMGNHKATGPDGMSVMFFKHYWDSMEKDFCEAISNFFYH